MAKHLSSEKQAALNTFERWLRAYQKSSLLILSIGLLSFLGILFTLTGTLGFSALSLVIVREIADLLLHTSLPEMAAKALAIVISMAFAAGFATLGIFASKGKEWCYYLGFGLYLADFLLLFLGRYAFSWSVLEAEFWIQFAIHLVFVLAFGLVGFYLFKAKKAMKAYNETK